MERSLNLVIDDNTKNRYGIPCLAFVQEIMYFQNQEDKSKVENRDLLGENLGNKMIV